MTSNRNLNQRIDKLERRPIPPHQLNRMWQDYHDGKPVRNKRGLRKIENMEKRLLWFEFTMLGVLGRMETDDWIQVSLNRRYITFTRSGYVLDALDGFDEELWEWVYWSVVTLGEEERDKALKAIRDDVDAYYKHWEAQEHAQDRP